LQIKTVELKTIKLLHDLLYFNNYHELVCLRSILLPILRRWRTWTLSLCCRCPRRTPERRVSDAHKPDSERERQTLQEEGSSG